MNVTQGTQTESISHRCHVHPTIHRHFFEGVGHFECLAHLNITLVIGDATPVLPEVAHQGQRRHRMSDG